MRRLVPPHLESWQPATVPQRQHGEEQHLHDVGAVLLLDAEGSTELSARLRARGTLVADALDELLTQIFGAAVDIVADHGGYIGHFTGDGVIGVFTGESTHAVARAVDAGVDILEHLDNVSGIVTPAGPVELSVRAVVGAGTIDTVVWRSSAIEDPSEQNATYVIVGSALAEAQRGEPLVAGGSIGVGPAADGALQNSLSPAESDRRPNESALHPHHPGTWRFVPPAIFDDDVVAEFLMTSVVFLELREWPSAHVIATILERCARYNGHISNVLRTSADQLGLTIMLIWGAPTTHPDDARRSLQFIASVQAALGSTSLRTGAVYSRTFRGFVGSDTQATYTAVGAPVNLAARLCELAEWGEIRVSESYDAVTPSLWTVQPIAPITYRGFPIAVATRSLRPNRQLT